MSSLGVSSLSRNPEVICCLLCCFNSGSRLYLQLNGHSLNTDKWECSENGKIVLIRLFYWESSLIVFCFVLFCQISFGVYKIKVLVGRHNVPSLRYTGIPLVFLVLNRSFLFQWQHLRHHTQKSQDKFEWGKEDTWPRGHWTGKATWLRVPGFSHYFSFITKRIVQKPPCWSSSRHRLLEKPVAPGERTRKRLPN